VVDAALSQAKIAESNPVPGQLNNLTVQVVPAIQLGAGSNLTVSFRGF